MSRCDLLRHLPPQQIQQLPPLIKVQHVTPGTTLFNAGDPANALYIVAEDEVDILGAPDPGSHEARHIARLDAGQAFGEMALLSGGTRTATALGLTANCW